ncbi:NUDIX hydrolase [Zymobacter sp. IVIA_12111.31 C1]|uniref:NUDIX hydrolase n=1 Tax=Zymobacter sp. IVIA_12111.31 C1 TaxID=3394854 RepID=UPI0039C171EF
MNFCSQCGHPVHQAIPDGDDRLRDVCSFCGTIHYSNPVIVAGTLPVQGSRVLLCQRAIEPGYGLWTLPAGFMENGETTVEAALRETREEAGAQVQNAMLYTVLDIPRFNNVYMIFRSELEGDFSAGIESLDVALFDEKDIPWDQIAFETVRRTLKLFFEDRVRGHFPLHQDVIR